MVQNLPDRLESNIRARVGSIRGAASKEMNIISGSVSDLTGLRPVPAVVNLVVGTIENAADVVKDQARITRNWFGMF